MSSAELVNYTHPLLVCLVCKESTSALGSEDATLVIHAASMFFGIDAADVFRCLADKVRISRNINDRICHLQAIGSWLNATHLMQDTLDIELIDEIRKFTEGIDDMPIEAPLFMGRRGSSAVKQQQLAKSCEAVPEPDDIHWKKTMSIAPLRKGSRTPNEKRMSEIDLVQLESDVKKVLESRDNNNNNNNKKSKDTDNITPREKDSIADCKFIIQQKIYAIESKIKEPRKQEIQKTGIHTLEGYLPDLTRTLFKRDADMIAIEMTRSEWNAFRSVDTKDFFYNISPNPKKDTPEKASRKQALRESTEARKRQLNLRSDRITRWIEMAIYRADETNSAQTLIAKLVQVMKILYTMCNYESMHQIYMSLLSNSVVSLYTESTSKDIKAIEDIITHKSSYAAYRRDLRRVEDNVNMAFIPIYAELFSDIVHQRDRPHVIDVAERGGKCIDVKTLRVKVGYVSAMVNRMYRIRNVKPYPALSMLNCMTGIFENVFALPSHLTNDNKTINVYEQSMIMNKGCCPDTCQELQCEESLNEFYRIRQRKSEKNYKPKKRDDILRAARDGKVGSMCPLKPKSRAVGMSKLASSGLKSLSSLPSAYSSRARGSSIQIDGSDLSSLSINSTSSWNSASFSSSTNQDNNHNNSDDSNSSSEKTAPKTSSSSGEYQKDTIKQVLRRSFTEEQAELMEQSRSSDKIENEPVLCLTARDYVKTRGSIMVSNSSKKS